MQGSIDNMRGFDRQFPDCGMLAIEIAGRWEVPTCCSLMLLPNLRVPWPKPGGGAELLPQAVWLNKP